MKQVAADVCTLAFACAAISNNRRRMYLVRTAANASSFADRECAADDCIDAWPQIQLSDNVVDAPLPVFNGGVARQPQRCHKCKRFVHG